MFFFGWFLGFSAWFIPKFPEVKSDPFKALGGPPSPIVMDGVRYSPVFHGRKLKGVFQHTELEHTPKYLYQQAKNAGIPFIVGKQGIAERVCDIVVCFLSIFLEWKIDG